jgi:hypothetical protein
VEKPTRRKRHRPVADGDLAGAQRTQRGTVPGRLATDAEARRRARERAGSDDY